MSRCEKSIYDPLSFSTFLTAYYLTTLHQINRAADLNIFLIVIYTLILRICCKYVSLYFLRIVFVVIIFNCIFQFINMSKYVSHVLHKRIFFWKNDNEKSKYFTLYCNVLI